MTRLLFPICAALLSTLAGLHLSTHLRQEEQRKCCRICTC